MTNNIINGPYSLVSVIIPVFNSEDYLEECLTSVVNQTYRHIEILLIDDGSTDKSGEICDKFASDDARIRVVHKDNQGRSKARNDGLELMTGEYYTFVDSDDMLKPDALELFVSEISDDPDILIARMMSFLPDRVMPYEPESREVKQISQDELLEIFALDNMHGGSDNYHIANGPCARLYSSKLKDIRFPEDLRYAEDYLYSLQIFLRCKKILYLDRILYQYRRYYEEQRHFWMEFKQFSVEGTDARIRAISIVENEKPEIYENYLFRSYYSILDTLCSCIELGYKDSINYIYPKLDHIKEELKHSDAVREISLFRRVKLYISFYSYRLYATLYRLIRRKERVTNE